MTPARRSGRVDPRGDAEPPSRLLAGKGATLNRDQRDFLRAWEESLARLVRKPDALADLFATSEVRSAWDRIALQANARPEERRARSRGGSRPRPQAAPGALMTATTRR
jgi:hypothetical protein